MRKPDRWFVLTAHVAADDPLRDLLGEGLLALGGLSVLDEGDALTTYLEPPSDGPARLLEVERFLAEWLADDAPELTWRWQANEDWEREWRKGRSVTEVPFAPSRLGRACAEARGRRTSSVNPSATQRRRW
jgi:hypothetical protein